MVPAVLVMLNVVVEVVDEGLSKNAQVPPHTVAPATAGLGVAETVNAPVAVDTTVVFAGNSPVPPELSE